MEIYVVQRGDTVDSIANGFGVAVETVIVTNQLIYPYRLAVGQALLINDGITNRDRYVDFNGFAYPFISSWVLENTLPYLTYLSVFSYGFTREGYLVYPQLADEWMIELAGQFETIPILTLTPLDELGRFNNNLITSIVNSTEYTNRLIEELLYVLESKGYGGVDVDFEYIKQEDRDLFTAFVVELHSRLSAQGYTVSVDLAPKTSANQPGLLYAGKDYAALGATADWVLLMTYEWGYKYGPPMAVAPINKVRQVVEYAVTEIDNRKINLGIPNYGYDWPLPFIQGETAATTLGNVEAVQIAVNQGVEIQYDEISQSPFFYYTENGLEHVVWFEDVRSWQEKFRLVQEYGLKGFAVWQIMKLFRAGWVLSDSLF